LTKRSEIGGESKENKKPQGKPQLSLTYAMIGRNGKRGIEVVIRKQ